MLPEAGRALVRRKMECQQRVLMMPLPCPACLIPCDPTPGSMQVHALVPAAALDGGHVRRPAGRLQLRLLV